MPESEDKIAAIVKRLASLPPEAQERELARLERLAAKQEAETHIRTLAKHQNKLAAAVVDAITRYSDEKRVPLDRIVPLTVTVTRSGDGERLVGTVQDPRGHGGTVRARGPGFFREQGVIAIELDGRSLEKCAEAEVLRVAYDAKVARDVYRKASPHSVALKPDTQQLIREKGFVAVFSDGTKEPLADLYARTRGRGGRR